MNKPVAIVTGASRKVGIGNAISLELARGGMDVFITYYRPYDQVSGLAGAADDPRALVEEIRSLGCRARELEIDLTEAQAPRRLFDQAEAELGPVSVLVNNATYSMRDGIEQLDADLLDKHYRLNLKAMALLCAEFVKRYKQHRPEIAPGRIINLSSGQSVGPMPGELAYAATKGAVEAFTVSLSPEVGPLDITVNAVDPGITDTGWIPPELHARWNLESPMGRVGVPADAARIIRFLASEDSGWITGQVIHSRGGL